MSYILDALRKSEQQRQQGAMPLLFTTQISSNIKKQPVLLLYGLVAAILICSGILIGWLRPWQQDETESLREPVALTQPEAKPPQISSIPQRLPPEPEKADKPELVLPEKKSLSTTKLASWAGSAKLDKPAPTKVTSQPHKSQTTIALQKAPEQVKDETAMPAKEKVMPSSVVPDATKDSAETAQEQKIIAMTELPQAIQQEIPMMAISGYAYSSIPKERIVGINDRLLQEGEYLAPGLRLEEIAVDGLVFSYKKYLFRHSL